MIRSRPLPEARLPASAWLSTVEDSRVPDYPLEGTGAGCLPENRGRHWIFALQSILKLRIFRTEKRTGADIAGKRLGKSPGGPPDKPIASNRKQRHARKILVCAVQKEREDLLLCFLLAKAAHKENKSVRLQVFLPDYSHPGSREDRLRGRQLDIAEETRAFAGFVRILIKGNC